MYLNSLKRQYFVWSKPKFQQSNIVFVKRKLMFLGKYHQNLLASPEFVLQSFQALEICYIGIVSLSFGLNNHSSKERNIRNSDS